MSRSYKKSPVYSDHSGNFTKYQKQLANKKVRKIKTIFKGKGYKKVYDSYYISDSSIFYTWKEYLKSEEELEGITLSSLELKILRNKWEKYYYRK